MKATVLQDDLNKGLANVTRVVSGRSQLPVLSNVLIEAESDGLVLTTTNMELGIRLVIGGKVEENGAITIPAKNLFEFVNTLPPGNVTLVGDGDRLKISSGKFGGTFTGISASEFPVIPKLGGKERVKIKIDKNIVESLSREVVFSAAVDESRPVLTGVQFKVNSGKTMATATDGFRLSRKTFSQQAPDKDGGWGEGLILPAKALSELSRVCLEGKKMEVEMEIVEGKNQVVFGYGQVQLISRVLGGNFPDVDKIIPSNYTGKVIIDREGLLAAVRAAAVFARDSSNIVKLAIEDNETRVSAVSQQAGESESVVESDLEGEKGTIAFNYRYVLDFLNSVSGDRVILLRESPIRRRTPSR
jgi:DNA polymerase-3 subunit beta